MKAWQESFWRAMELDAVARRSMSSRHTPSIAPKSRRHRWLIPLVNSPLGKPLRHLAGIEILELSGEIFSLIRRSNFCTLSPDACVQQVEGSRSSWNLGTHYGYTNYLRAWRIWRRRLAGTELTRKILQVKAARNSQGTRDWPSS